MGCAFNGLVLVDVLDDRLDLLFGVSQLVQSHRYGLIDNFHQPAAYQLLVFDECNVRLHTSCVAVHHEPDGAGRCQYRCLSVAIAMLLA